MVFIDISQSHASLALDVKDTVKGDNPMEQNVADECHEVMSKAMTLAVVRGWDWREYARTIQFEGSFTQLINAVCDNSYLESVLYHPRFSQALFREYEESILNQMTLSNNKMGILHEFVLKLL